MDRFLLFNQTAAIRREAFVKAGGFDVTMRYMEDADLALRLSLLGLFAFIREPLAVYHRGSAGSLADEALTGWTSVNENMVMTRERVHQLVKANGDYSQLRRPARRALRKSRRELWVARLGQKKRILGAPTVSHILKRAEYYLGAIAARSPWYERMKVVSIPNQAAYGSDATTESRRQDIGR